MHKYSKIKTDIRQKIPQVKSYLLIEKNLIAAYLFGSFAKDNDDKLSDVDIALLFDRKLTKEQMHQLEVKIWSVLTEILRTDEIDLFVMNNIPLRMQFEIIYSGKVICNNDNNQRTDYEVRTCARYWDFKKYLDEYDRCSLQRLKEKYVKEELHEA